MSDSQSGDSTPKRSKSAVDAPRRNYFMVDPRKLIVIGLDTDDGEEHPLYDPRVKLPINPSLVANIKWQGVKVPIQAKKDGDRLLVVDGRRRDIHARIACEELIAEGGEPLLVPVIVVNGDDASLFGMARSLNAYGVQDGPMTRARNAQRLIAMGASEADVALAENVSTQTVTNWLAILSTHPDVHAAIEAEIISPTAAMMLAPLSREDQKATLAEVTDGGKTKPTVERVRRTVADKTGRPAGNTPKEKIEKISGHLMKLSASSSTTKDELLEVINKICRIATGHSLEKLGDLGD